MVLQVIILQLFIYLGDTDALASEDSLQSECRHILTYFLTSLRYPDSLASNAIRL